MDGQQASQTALMVAAYRGRASLQPNALIHDPWAAQLAGDEGMEISEAFDRMWSHMELWIAVRTAFLDHKVAQLTAPGGARQVVILGAGLDTRAARMGRDGVRFFEVDHPATQAEKIHRLGSLAGYPVDAATYAPCDFERDDFLDRLTAVGFDARSAAVIVWEGVVPYLTEPAVRQTARRIATGCEPHTALLFDYVLKRMVEGERLRENDKQAVELVNRLGEPIRFGTDDPLPLLYDCGFRHIRTVTFDQACLTLTGTYDRERAFRFQNIAIASVVPGDPALD